MDALHIEVRPRFVAYVGHSLSGFIRSIFTVLFSILTVGLFPLIGYIRVRCTKIRVAQGRIQIEKGVFRKRRKNYDIWRILNIELEQSLVNRWTGDGTLALILSPLASADRRHRGKKHSGAEQFVDVIGLAHGDDLEPTYQKLLSLTFDLRGNPVVKGIIQ